jgi:hypothetical protein
MTFQSHSTMPSRSPVKRIKQINAFISAKCPAEAFLVCFADSGGPLQVIYKHLVFNGLSGLRMPRESGFRVDPQKHWYKTLSRKRNWLRGKGEWLAIERAQLTAESTASAYQSRRNS